jgi:hypothetical protein
MGQKGRKQTESGPEFMAANPGMLLEVKGWGIGVETVV